MDAVYAQPGRESIDVAWLSERRFEIDDAADLRLVPDPVVDRASPRDHRRVVAAAIRFLGEESGGPDPAEGTKLVEERRQPCVDLVGGVTAQVVGADEHQAIRDPLHREDLGVQLVDCLEDALTGDGRIHDRHAEQALGDEGPGVAVVVVPRDVAAHAAGHIALGDAVPERDHREGIWTLHVDGIDRRGSHEWRPGGRILRGHGATRPGVAIREVVDVARGHRAIDVEGNVQLVPEGDREVDRVAGHALSRIAREAGRAVEVDRDGRGRKLALNPGQRDGGGV